MLSAAICNLLFQSSPPKHKSSSLLAHICCCPSPSYQTGNPDLREPLLSVNVAIAPVLTINSLTERVTVLEGKVEFLNTRIEEITDSNTGMMNQFTETNAQMLDSFAGAMVDKTNRAFIDFEKAIAYEMAHKPNSARRLSCPE